MSRKVHCHRHQMIRDHPPPPRREDTMVSEAAERPIQTANSLQYLAMGRLQKSHGRGLGNEWKGRMWRR